MHIFVVAIRVWDHLSPQTEGVIALLTNLLDSIWNVSVLIGVVSFMMIMHSSKVALRNDKISSIKWNMLWPANSSDLNPIEHGGFWRSVFDSTLFNIIKTPSKRRSFKRMVFIVPPVGSQKRPELMSRNIKAVLEACVEQLNTITVHMGDQLISVCEYWFGNHCVHV